MGKTRFPPQVIAESVVMREIVQVVSRLASARGAVLLEGESGTGKDLVAYLIHAMSPRRDAPLIRIHCPSVPPDLMEADLFGWGTSVSADVPAPKIGKLELCSGGTLYLDQIHDLEPSSQAKLLGVLEEQAFERAGSDTRVGADVRIVSSSNADLREFVRKGMFREDLYRRLSVLPLTLPPLRNRREDIAPLASLFLERERERGTTAAVGFDEDALAALRGYHWPGNVRELRLAIARAAEITSSEEVGVRALPPPLFDQPLTLWAGRERTPSLRAVEEAYIRHVLERADGNQTKAAKTLGISRKSLWEKRRRYGIA